MSNSNPKGKNFILTKNNPTETLEEFFNILKKDSVYAKAQLERGESGTPHFQATVGYSKESRVNKMRKQFPNCHIEISRNAMKAWVYCGKEDTRLEGPMEHGIPPASKAVKGDT